MDCFISCNRYLLNLHLHHRCCNTRGIIIVDPQVTALIKGVKKASKMARKATRKNSGKRHRTEKPREPPEANQIGDKSPQTANRTPNAQDEKPTDNANTITNSSSRGSDLPPIDGDTIETDSNDMNFNENDSSSMHSEDEFTGTSEEGTGVGRLENNTSPEDAKTRVEGEDQNLIYSNFDKQELINEPDDPSSDECEDTVLARLDRLESLRGLQEANEDSSNAFVEDSLPPIAPRFIAEGVAKKRGNIDFLRRGVLKALKGNNIRDYPVILFDGLPLFGIPNCITRDKKLTPEEKVLFDLLNGMLDHECNQYVFSGIRSTTLTSRLYTITSYLEYLASRKISELRVQGTLVRDFMKTKIVGSNRHRAGKFYSSNSYSNIQSGAVLLNEIILNYKYRPESTDPEVVNLNGYERNSAKNKESKEFVGPRDVKNFVHDRKIDEQDNSWDPNEEHDRDFDLSLDEIRLAVSYFWEQMTSPENAEREINSIKEFLEGFSLYIRGSNKKELAFCDLDLKEFTDMTVLKFKLYEKSRPTDESIPFNGVARHKYADMCLVGIIALGFWYQFDFELGDFYGSNKLDFTDSNEFAHCKLLRTKNSSKFAKISETYHNNLAKVALERLGKPNSKSTTHVGRKIGSQYAAIHGADFNEIRKHGRWGNDVMTMSYLTNLHTPGLYQVMAGFKPRSEEPYYVPRLKVKPPESLRKRIFGWLEDDQEACKRANEKRKKKDMFSEKFLKMLDSFRDIILQDMCHIVKRFPNCIFSKHPIMNSQEFLDFQKKVLESSGQLLQLPTADTIVLLNSDVKSMFGEIAKAIGAQSVSLTNLMESNLKQLENQHKQLEDRDKKLEEMMEIMEMMKHQISRSEQTVVNRSAAQNLKIYKRVEEIRSGRAEKRRKAESRQLPNSPRVPGELLPFNLNEDANTEHGIPLFHGQPQHYYYPTQVLDQLNINTAPQMPPQSTLEGRSTMSMSPYNTSGSSASSHVSGFSVQSGVVISPTVVSPSNSSGLDEEELRKLSFMRKDSSSVMSLLKLWYLGEPDTLSIAAREKKYKNKWRRSDATHATYYSRRRIINYLNTLLKEISNGCLHVSSLQ